MSAEWKRAPLPEGHEEEGLTHDGSNGMGRILLAGLAVGGVIVVLNWYRTDAEIDRNAAERVRRGDHLNRPSAAQDATITGVIHLNRANVDVDVGDLGWQFRGDRFETQLYLASGDAELGVNATHRAPGRGTIGDLAKVWAHASDALCEPTTLRRDDDAIYCNNDPEHVWAWADPDGPYVLYVHYEYASVERQPDFAEIERIVGSVR